MSTPSAPVTFRYLARFQCVGSACEDTCCGDWRVEVDDATHEKLVALSKSGRDPLPLASMIVPIEPPEGDARWAMKRGAAGTCCMLDEERLCSLQKQHGAELLPDVCTLFPRQQSRVLEQLEVTATVACPEIARLLLLGDDAMTVEPMAPGQPSRPRVEQAIAAVESDPYRRHFLLVRTVLLELLGASHCSVDARLFFISYFAASIHAFYRQGAAEFPVAALEHQARLILNPEAQRHLAGQFDALPFEPGVAHLVIECIRVIATDVSPRLALLLAAALEGCDAPEAPNPVRLLGRDLHLSAERIARSHVERKSRLPPAHARRLDGSIERYFLNLTVQSWYLDSHDLFLHHQALLIRLALLRFLVLGQPDVATDPDALDRAIVAAFSTVTRAFEHNRLVGPALAEAIRAMGRSSPAHAAGILKF